MRAALVVVLLLGCRGGSTAPPVPRCTTPVRASSQADLDAVRGCTRLPALSLRGAVPFDLTPLAELATIDGDLAVRSTFALGSVRLPALTRVGGDLDITTNLDLTGVYLPLLVSARNLTVAEAPALIELMLPKLADVPGRLTVRRLPSLELIDLSSLPPDTQRTVEDTPRVATWLGPGDPRSEP